MFIGWRFLDSLFFSIAVETLTALILLNYFWKEKRLIKEIIFWGVISTSLTLPYVWFVGELFFNGWKYYLLICEAIVCLVEAFLYWYGLRVEWRRAIVLSLLANFLSFWLWRYLNM